MTSQEKALRILHTESSMGLGGQEYATLALVEGLQKRGHVVVLLVQAGSQLQTAAEERGVLCHTLTMHKALYPWAIFRMCALIQKHQIEVVHTHGSRDSWIGSFAAWFSSLKPVVVLSRHKSTPIAKHAINRVLYHRLVDRIVTTGGELIRKHLLAEHQFPEHHVVAIPTGADVERFSPNIEGDSFRKEWGVTKEECLIGAVCFLRSYKGLDHFIEAAAIVLTESPSCRFVIVGDGPEQERLEAKIAQWELQGRFILTGHREDVPEVMAALDIFVVSSTDGETLTQTIPQALAMETPVVATNIGSIPDIIHHEETGFLVSPGDPQALASYILKLVEDPERGATMACEGRALVLNSFSSQSTVVKNEALYQDLLHEKRGRL
ncbi:MAG: glycosyltransferase [Nitrospirae bacterium]|nr:glycosyltransferase [Nitrospirota bacterium]MDA1303645.1 glycosyltransferase [Nitrospirota bacterium]